MKSVCLKYAPSLPNALNSISLKIAPGAKVGVCGRTGCGKSSLFVALFRLFEPHSGSIIVGGSRTMGASLDSLRSRLSIIPQEPVLFGGSLRENVDPLALHTDEAVQVTCAQQRFIVWFIWL
jgi:ATP-binding cassette subfamily C (CFTR/MRP) protein 1